jgi:hypothetical protein
VSGAGGEALPFLDRPENRLRIKAAVERVMGRLEGGEPMPQVTIPDDKAEFPKILCLDQNKWIDLARAHYGRADGAPFVDVLKAVRQAVSLGRLMVPILASNLAEVSEPADEGRRLRLAEFMLDLSGNCSMVNPRPLRKCELKAGLQLLFLQQPGSRCPRSRTVRWGIFAALGRAPSSENPLLQHGLYEPELAVLAMVAALDREDIRQLREHDKRAEAAFNRAREAGLPEEQRRDAEFRALLERGTTADDLFEAANKLSIDHDQLGEWLETNRVAFADTVPNIDVASRLLFARDRNPDHKTHQNDLKDLVFLEVAIPYGNIVVAEKSWAHLANAVKLGERYDTRILTDARELPEALTDAGCLSTPNNLDDGR